jgi:hypothetical protein
LGLVLTNGIPDSWIHGLVLAAIFPRKELQIGYRLSPKRVQGLQISDCELKKPFRLKSRGKVQGNGIDEEGKMRQKEEEGIRGFREERR